MNLEAKTMTVAAFDEWVKLPQNADKLFEYIGGEVVVVPSNPYVSKIALRIGRYVDTFVDENDLGHVTGEAGGYMVAGERYAPDVAFISKARQPELAHRGYNPNPPDLAIEVVSPSDDLHDVRIKIANYMAAGTVVWVVNPETKTVEIYASGEPVQMVDDKGTLDGGSVLPGFALKVADIFR